MTDATGDRFIPDPAERQKLNAALLANGTQTGFCDEHGRLAPWPDDIDHWQPETGQPITLQAGEQPF
jgi:hypothetical protein